MSQPLEISVQATPNPNAAKFTLNRVVASQGVTYRKAATEAGPTPTGGEADGSAEGRSPRPAAATPWAKELLTIAGVTQVFALNNFISVNKTPEVEWDVVGPQVEQVLRRAFA